MKKIFSFLLLSLMTTLFLGQSNNYKTAADVFQNDYNSEKYEAIYNSFSSEMKEALPLENTKSFLDGLKLQVGKIETKEFIDYKQTYAVYKTKFERAVFAVNISLDEQNKINGLFIKPYEEPKENTSETDNKTVNALHDFPENIGEVIFLKVRDFPNNTQVSIAFIENGKAQFYGIIKQNDTVKSIKNQNKVFEIGSITKAFTATILASLVEDKKINLSDNINSYYTFPFKGDVKLNFQSLANHTSGLPRLPDNLDLSNESNPYKNYGKKEIEAYLKNNLKLENNPKYEYSNLGAGLLGYTLGLSQKTSFQHLLQKRIFERYKMKNSYTNSENLKDKLVNGLDENGEKVANWDFDVLFGGGGILSTTEDLAKFIEAQFNIENKELTLTRQPTFTISDNMKIGLGWHILKNKNNSEFLWHNGGTGGYSSSLAFNAENKNAVIILSNVSAFNPKMENIDKLCFELMNFTSKK